MKLFNLYLVGSLRNPQIPVIAAHLRSAGIEVFDDWYSAGPNADDCLRDHYRERNFSYSQTLASPAAQNIFNFDKRNLDVSDGALLVLPAGKSGHLELGYMIGKGKWSGILVDAEPERVDIMHNFALMTTEHLDEIIWSIRAHAL